MSNDMQSIFLGMAVSDPVADVVVLPPAAYTNDEREGLWNNLLATNSRS